MKKLAVLGLVFGAMMTSNAFAGSNVIAEGSAKVRTSPSEVSRELVAKVKLQSETNAFENCTRSNDYDICEIAKTTTVCEQTASRRLLTRTDIISEKNDGPETVTISCETVLEF